MPIFYKTKTGSIINVSGDINNLIYDNPNIVEPIEINLSTQIEEDKFLYDLNLNNNTKFNYYELYYNGLRMANNIDYNVKNNKVELLTIEPMIGDTLIFVYNKTSNLNQILKYEVTEEKWIAGIEREFAIKITYEDHGCKDFERIVAFPMPAYTNEDNAGFIGALSSPLYGDDGTIIIESDFKWNGNILLLATTPMDVEDTKLREEVEELKKSITLDLEPSQGSSNIITSGAVYDYIEEKLKNLEGGNEETSDYFYKCNGVNDNEIITQICADFLAGTSTSSKTLYLKGQGVFGVRAPVVGTGSGADPYIYLQVLNTSTSGKRITLDFEAVDFTQANYAIAYEPVAMPISAFAKITYCTFKGNVTIRVTNSGTYKASTVRGLTDSTNNIVIGDWTINSAGHDGGSIGLYNSSDNKITGNWSMRSHWRQTYGLYNSSNNEVLGNWLIQTDTNTSQHGSQYANVYGLYNSSNNIVKGDWNLRARDGDTIGYAVTATGIHAGSNNQISGNWTLFGQHFSGKGSVVAGMRLGSNNTIIDGTWDLTAYGGQGAYQSEGPSTVQLILDTTSFELRNLKVKVLFSSPAYLNSIVLTSSTASTSKYIIDNCKFWAPNELISSTTPINLGTSTNISYSISNCLFQTGFLENVMPPLAEGKRYFTNNNIMDLNEV